ncbi:protein-glutamate O-methyltransferase CheR [soil metagenome]
MSIDNVEMNIAPLLETIFQLYGFDFRDYSEAHLKRRVKYRMALSHISTVGELQERAITDVNFAALLLQDLSITVTEMFRDPDFYTVLRQTVIPMLKTYSFIKIWHAGCSTGQEPYSMAILLQEEGLYDRATIYATDFNQSALEQAKSGIYTIEQVREYTANYQRSGGKEDFSKYYTSQYNNAIFNQSLKKNIVWANHNLVTDGVFAEVHLLLCRNVLIYFNVELQARVHQLFHNSLITGGILCLGSKEGIRVGDVHEKYGEIDKKQRIFKKKY